MTRKGAMTGIPAHQAIRSWVAVVKIHDVLKHKFLNPDMYSLPSAASSATVSSSSKPDHNSAGLDTGTIAGIVVCTWVGCSLMAIIAMWLLCRKPRQKKQTNVRKSNKMGASSQPYDKLDDWHQDTLETQSPAGLNQQALLATSSLSSHYSRSIPLVEYAQNRDQHPHTNQIGNSQSHAQYTDTASTSSQTDNSKQ
ncbi:hypothetical protein NM208_g5833 [Fusarium decemcellulare]|uniref:Uncharacterized protein n=1 Tax=Fusarium decemcellulare TaxID=57161 RepID=A0ACC1SFJ2_9HYPO|nr:hypothetical protein NM208_g5833 [Fusarium decemcellulare]